MHLEFYLTPHVSLYQIISLTCRRFSCLEEKQATARWPAKQLASKTIKHDNRTLATTRAEVAAKAVVTGQLTAS